MAGKKGMIHYSKEVKLQAVQMFLEQGLSQREIAQMLGLSHKKLVEHWLHRYRREGSEGFDKPIGRPRKEPQTPQAYVERLEMENALLKKLHTELRKAMLARRNTGSSNTTEEAIQ